MHHMGTECQRVVWTTFTSVKAVVLAPNIAPSVRRHKKHCTKVHKGAQNNAMGKFK